MKRRGLRMMFAIVALAGLNVLLARSQGQANPYYNICYYEMGSQGTCLEQCEFCVECGCGADACYRTVDCQEKQLQGP